MTNEERYESIDRRLEAVAMNLQLTASMTHTSGVNVEKLLAAVEKDAENIRALVRIAEIHGNK